MRSETAPNSKFPWDYQSKPQPKPDGPGRPRVLDDKKRAEICALIAVGCGLQDAAKYIRCSVNTIRREADRNPDFQDQIRRSEAYAELSPLRAMQRAVRTNWRAAAWFLERAFPERFARPEAGAFGCRQTRQLMNEVLDVIEREIHDPSRRRRMEKLIRGTFQHHLRLATDRRRASRKLRLAIESSEEKNRAADPLAQFPVALDVDLGSNPDGNTSATAPTHVSGESACVAQTSEPATAAPDPTPDGKNPAEPNIPPVLEHSQ